MVGTELLAQRELVITARGSDYRGAQGLTQLNGSATDATRRTQNKQSFSGLNLRSLHQRVVRREVSNRNPSSGLKRQRRGLGQNRQFMGDHLPAKTTGTSAMDHLITHFPAGHVRTDCLNHAGTLATRYKG